MRAARDVEQDAVRRIDRDERGVALAPVGDVVEELAVACRVLGDDGKIRITRAGFGERQARPQPQGFRPRIDRDQVLGIAALAGDDERARIMRRPRSHDAIGRKPHQP